MTTMTDHSKMKKIRDIVIKYFIPIMLLTLFIMLAYRQITIPKEYPSDISQHIRIAQEGKGYSFLYKALELILLIAGNRYKAIVIAVFEGLLSILTIYPTAAWMRKRYQVEHWLSFLAAEGLLFLSSFYFPVLQPLFYKSGIVTQPWHNITYIGMRLFAALTLCFFSDILDIYQQEISFRDWLKIALPLTIATGIKPNFLLAFSWTLLLFLIADAVKGRFRKKTLLQCIKMGTTVFPALIILYLQSKVLYGGTGRSTGGEVSGIGVALVSSRFFSLGLKGTILKLARGILLAVIVAAYNTRKDRRKASKFEYLLYLTALLQVIVFYETGKRANDGNFYWTLYISGYLLYIRVIAGWIRNLRDMNWQSVREKCYAVITSALVAAHLVSGVCYFILLSLGSHYTI